MTLSYVDKFSTNNGGTPNDTSTLSVAAQAGDLITCAIAWRNNVTIESVQWGAQVMTLQGSVIEHDECRLAIYTAVAGSNATSNIVVAFTNNTFSSCQALVHRPSTNDTLNYSSVTYKAFTSADIPNYVAPSITTSSIPTNSVLFSFFVGMAWDKNYGDTSATTYTAEAPLTLRDSVQNTGWQGVNWLCAATGTASGSVTAAWTPSAGQPRYVQAAFYVTATSSETIDTLATTLIPGVSTPVETTGLGTITGGTFGGQAINVSAPGGDGTLSPLAWVDGLVQPLSVGNTYTVSLTDGDKTATRNAIYGMPAGLAHRTIPGTVSTADDSLYKEPLLAPGTDVFIPDWLNPLMDDDGTLRDVPFGSYSGFWLRDLDYIMTSFSVVITETGVSVEFSRVIIGTKAVGRVLTGKFLSGKLL